MISPKILCGEVQRFIAGDYTPSKRVVMSLQAVMPNVKTTCFKRNVLDAITKDTITEDADSLSEILASWKERFQIVPDAYLIDPQKKTVVCFEVEDRHHLKPRKVEQYGGAWWCLEYIYWNLHLIAYDIYGNPRVIELPESYYIARELLDNQDARQDQETQKNADDYNPLLGV